MVATAKLDCACQCNKPETTSGTKQEIAIVSNVQPDTRITYGTIDLQNMIDGKQRSNTGPEKVSAMSNIPPELRPSENISPVVRKRMAERVSGLGKSESSTTGGVGNSAWPASHAELELGKFWFLVTMIASIQSALDMMC